MRLVVLLLLLPTFVFAQEFPARSVTIVVPYPPGSTSDLIPRAISPLMSESLGVPVVVENRPGAGGNIGAAMVARGDASGHTLVSAPTPVLAVNQWLYKDPGFDPQKDFTPVINAAVTPNMWVTHPDTPVKTIADVIQAARAKPGALAFASGGSGTTSHLCGELLKATAKIDLLHVPYKGPAPALQDVMAGRVQLMCDNFSNVISHVRSGKLKAVALTALNRHPQAPEVPTAHETGLAGFEMGIFYGFAVPSGTPPAAVQRLNAEIAKALRDPKIAERLATLGLDIVADSPESFAKFVAAERERMRKLVEASGARVD
jgi:tripartite-type tricarboxylate transporter receptor subunit TctC